MKLHLNQHIVLNVKFGHSIEDLMNIIHIALIMAFLFLIQDFLCNSGTIIGKKIHRNIIIIIVQ